MSTPQRLQKMPQINEFHNLSYYTNEEIEYIQTHKDKFLNDHFLSSDFDVLDLVFEDNDINKLYYFNHRFGEGGVQYLYTSPLNAAIISNRVDLVTYLISKGADPNHITIFEQTARHGGTVIYIPLLTAIEYGNTEIIKILLDAGANINNDSMDSGEYSETHTMYPLTYALSLGNFDVAYLLISYGADLNYIDIRGYNYRMPINGIFVYFEDMFSFFRSDRIIVRNRDEIIPMIEQLIQNGLNVKESRYPIVRIILEDMYENVRSFDLYLSALKLFLSYGADPNLDSDGKYYYRSADVTILLLAYGYKFTPEEIQGIINGATSKGDQSIVNYFTNYIE